MPRIQAFVNAVRQTSGFQTFIRFLPVFLLSAVYPFAMSAGVSPLIKLSPLSSAFPLEHRYGVSLASINLFILPLFFASGILATLYCEAWGKGRLATYAGATFAMVATLAILLAAGSDNSTLAFLLAGLSLLSFHVERRQNTQANDLFWQSAFNAARVIFTTAFWLGLIFFIAWFTLDFLAPPHKNKIIGTAVWIFFFALLGLALVFQSLSLFTEPQRATTQKLTDKKTLSPPTRHAICLLLCCGLFWLGHFYFLLATGYTRSIFELNRPHIFFESLFYHALITTVLCTAVFFATYPLRIEKSGLRAQLSRVIPALALPVAIIGIYAGIEKIISHRIEIKNLMQFVFLCWGALMFSAALALRTKFQIKWISASLAFICLLAAIPAVSARDMFLHYHEHQLLSAAKEADLLDLTGQFKEKLAYANIPSETEEKLRAHIEALRLSRSPAASKYLELLHGPMQGKTKNSPHTQYLSFSKSVNHWLPSNGFDYIVRFEPKLSNARLIDLADNTILHLQQDERITKSLSQDSPLRLQQPHNNISGQQGDVNLDTEARITRIFSEDAVLQLKLHTTQNGDTIPPLVFNIYEHFLKNVLPMVPKPGGLETDAASKIYAENEYMRAELELINMNYTYRPSGDPKDIIGINSIRSIIRLSLKDAAKQQKETP